MKNFGLLPFSSSVLCYVPTISCPFPSFSSTLPFTYPYSFHSTPSPFLLSSPPPFFPLVYLFLNLSFKKTANSQPANSRLACSQSFFPALTRTLVHFFIKHSTPHNTHRTGSIFIFFSQPTNQPIQRKFNTLNTMSFIKRRGAT